MRSRNNVPGLALAGVLVLFAGVALRSASGQEVASGSRAAARDSGDRRPDDVAIRRALEKVKADPNLATERTIKALRWKGSNVKRSTRGMPAWLTWVGGLFRWLDQSARVLVWCAAAVLAGMFVVYLVRIGRSARAEARGRSFSVPTHVRDLDIRPETLPDDVGAAARALWERGEQRAAVALLYRGLLSRLAHVHRVPIRESSTEGDCLALAAVHVTLDRHEFAARLVGVWQRFVYGREDVGSAAVYALCEDFAKVLDLSSASTRGSTA